jgi:uncharacterized protein (DUF1778 family)
MAKTVDQSSRNVRGQRIDFRASGHDKQLIQRAAERTGISMADFILRIVLPEAERIAADPSQVLLSEKDLERFYQELDRKPEILPNLRKLSARPNPFVHKDQ